MKVVRHQKGLPRETVDATSLAVFKASLDRALSNLVSWDYGSVMKVNICGTKQLGKDVSMEL